METENTLSVIIPVYNAKPELLERCIISIVEGININREMIVIDDGSDKIKSKEYKNICDNYGGHYFRQENQGVSCARNQGICLAQGNIIMFADADDRIIKADYSGWIHWMIENQVDVLSGCLCKKYGDGRTEEKRIHKEGVLFFYKNEDLIQLILTRNHYDYPKLKDVEIAGPCCKLIKKSMLGQTKFPSDIRIGEDMVFNLELLKKNARYVLVNELWYEYYISCETAMNKYYTGLEERYFASINRIAGMDLTKTEEEYLACRALYHYIKIIKIYVSHKKKEADACISFIKKISCKEELRQCWKRIKLRKCTLETKYKIALALTKSRQNYLLYQMIKLSINKENKRSRE